MLALKAALKAGLWALLTASPLVWPACPEDPPPLSLKVGINPQVFHGFDDEIKARILDSGARLIRVGRHNKLEDDAITWAGQNGIEVLMFCGYTRGLPITSSASARQRYADLCLADVRRLDPEARIIRYIEVWNEWNIGFGLGGIDACRDDPGHPCRNAALYADLLEKVYDTFKAARPDILIVGGAVAGMGLEFMGKLLDAGGYEKMDLLSWHFYSKPNTSCSNALEAPGADVAAKWLSCVGKVRDLFTSRGLLPKRQLFTEWGRFDNGTDLRKKLSADTILAMHEAARKSPDVAGLFWFDLAGRGSPKNEGFGLFDRQGGKKPQFFAFKAFKAGVP